MGGRTFRIYKFRTMVADSDDVEKYLNSDQLAQWRLERKVDDDPRITPLGRKLRSTSVDEIPNFINVLKGDMSVIGPRPMILAEYEQIEARARYGANDIRPGLTGWAQINGRDAVTVEEKARLDG